MVGSDDPRDALLTDYCTSCYRPAGHEGCGQVFSTLLAPAHCPEALDRTHRVCPSCLELYPQDRDHASRCLFAQHGLTLRAAGWSTAASSAVLRAIRRPAAPLRAPLTNLLFVLLRDIVAEGTTVVPVPMGTAGSTRWLAIVHEATSRMNGVDVQPVLVRDRLRSTRNSGAQTRERIAREEYRVATALIPAIAGRRVVLLDDNVTTGNTMIHCAQQLQQYGAAEVIPVAIERYVSPRVLQRCPPPGRIGCPHWVDAGLSHTDL